MKDRSAGTAGFTLIELVMIIAIVAILSSIGTFAFHSWTVKTNVAAQAQQLATDLGETRLRAMTAKLRHSLTTNPNSYVFKSYSSDYESLSAGTVIPGGSHRAVYPLRRKSAGSAIPCAGECYEIDQRGMLVGPAATIFINFGGSSNLDCVNINPVIASAGKTNTVGAVCNDQ